MLLIHASKAQWSSLQCNSKMKWICLITCEFLLIIFTVQCEKLLTLTAAHWQRAILDNLIHGAIGGLVWWTVVQGRLLLGQICTCAILASAIDADHFIAAASLSLDAALSLPARPPLHNSSLMFAVNLVLVVISRLTIHQYRLEWMQQIPSLFCAAWMSHHLRDATRRGLWFAPFGHTTALPQWFYITSVALLPLIISFIHSCTKLSSAESVVLEITTL